MRLPNETKGDGQFDVHPHFLGLGLRREDGLWLNDEDHHFEQLCLAVRREDTEQRWR